jgi:hypothetical protein
MRETLTPREARWGVRFPFFTFVSFVGAGFAFACG